MSNTDTIHSKENESEGHTAQLMAESPGRTMAPPPLGLGAGKGFQPVQMQKAPVSPLQLQTERKKGKGINNHLNISEKGLQFIIKNEGMVKNSSGDKHVLYDDSEDFATIGYGHLVARKKVSSLTVKEKERWKNGLTEGQALKLLKQDSLKFVKALRKNVTTELQQHEFDALVSWAFNVGEGWFGGDHEQATAIKRINSGDLSEVGNSLGMFQKADGKFNQGVLNRRNREINVFNYGYGDKDDEFREKGDMAAPQGKNKYKDDYWGKHLKKHTDISKLDKLDSAELSGKSAADIWTECGESSEKVAAKLAPALTGSTKPIEDMLDYLSASQDNFAFYLVSPASESNLRKVNADLLKQLKSAMNSGSVTEEEYKAIGKIDYILGEAVEEKAKSDKEKKDLDADGKKLAGAKKVKNKETPLDGSVGLKGKNKPKDIAMVKYQLKKLNVITAKEYASNDMDLLEQLIRRYQRRVFGKYNDGLISASGTTANRLMQGVRGVAGNSADNIETIEKQEKTSKQNSLKEAKSDASAVKKIYDSVDGDSEKLGKKMADYLRTNPDMVNAMLNYANYFSTDNIAYHIAKNTDKNSLRSADKTLLQRLYDFMDSGYTDAKDFEIMAKLAEYIAMPEDLANFDEKELDVKKYWKSQGSTPNCDIYTKKVIDGHKKDNPSLYEDFGDIGSSKTTKENSFHTVWEDDWEKGLSRKQGPRNGNNHSTLNKDEGEWEMAIRYITACIEAGVPVMVGVNHTFAYSRASGNNDKSTDHWLTVIGKGQDAKGKYFIYTDPGTGRKNVGTDSDGNRLYQKEDAHIWRDDKKYADSDAGNGSYTLVAVTLYDKHRGKPEFQVGSQTFTRDFK